MNHSFFFDGNEKRIGWSIQSYESKIEQVREHHNIYLNKVTKEQSKLMALHVGLFWGIGKFIIKNEDRFKVMVDSKSMMNYLTKEEIPIDYFLKTRIHFIDHLINQRKLKIHYELISPEENYVSKSI